ncbi:restriction endonuclease [Methanobacterium formicicum]|uniref:Restriction endonuclease type IV Mrr domain-containing protein n=1 Tax=Methanobacterium formicicum (strain DSM 3637 / PP1) TaxID=1204725 RepID=K2R1Z8_METFP|nr:restriction endonuclease [Methanobacterium formicicum]EKF86553.1 hypothetical protein A994_03683 [Methanobacterium formicicum DSM 3637]
MFYRSESSGYNGSIDLVKETLNKFAGLKRVSPLLISKELPEMSEEDILSIIFQLSKEKYLNINYEITCPECSSDVITLSSLKDIPDKVICEICDICNEFIPTSSDIWITITIENEIQVQDVKDQVIDKNTTNLNLNDAFNNIEFSSLVDDEFFIIDIDKFNLLLLDVINANTNDEKKNSMENLGEYLFTNIANFEIVERNKRTPTSELDIVSENNNAFHPFLTSLGLLIPIECKNWKSAIGASEIRDFGADMVNRKFQTGILISKSGITGERKFKTDAQGELVNFFKQNAKILVLTLEDLYQISDGISLLTILRKRNRELHLS